VTLVARGGMAALHASNRHVVKALLDLRVCLLRLRSGMLGTGHYQGKCVHFGIKQPQGFRLRRKKRLCCKLRKVVQVFWGMGHNNAPFKNSSRAAGAKRGVEQQIQPIRCDIVATSGADAVGAFDDPIQCGGDLAQFLLPRKAQGFKDFVGLAFGCLIVPVLWRWRVRFRLDPGQARCQLGGAGFNLSLAVGVGHPGPP